MPGMDISTVAAFAALCKTVIETGKMLGTEVSSDEDRLLEHACHHGIIELVSHRDLLTVYAGGRLFCKDTDPADRLRYVSAFKSLCERGYVFPEEGTRFSLSYQAIELGRRIAEECQSFDRARIAKPYVPHMTADERSVISDMRLHNQFVYAVPAEGELMIQIGQIRHFHTGADCQQRAFATINGLLSRKWIEPCDASRTYFRLTLHRARAADAAIAHGKQDHVQ
jgi:hypothetical protein